MLTPIELHNAEHKTGRGYSRKEMDAFLEDVFDNYEKLYKENADLKDKLSQLSDGIQYYKAMESTLQKALVLAEKTSKDTIDAANAKAKDIIDSANSKASMIEKEANIKADKLVNDGLIKLDDINKQCLSLLQQYNQFRAQYKQIAVKQIELLDGDFYEIYTKDMIDSITRSDNYSEKEAEKVDANADTNRSSEVKYDEKEAELAKTKEIKIDFDDAEGSNSDLGDEVSGKEAVDATNDVNAEVKLEDIIPNAKNLNNETDKADANGTDTEGEAAESDNIPVNSITTNTQEMDFIKESLEESLKQITSESNDIIPDDNMSETNNDDDSSLNSIFKELKDDLSADNNPENSGFEFINK